MGATAPGSSSGSVCGEGLAASTPASTLRQRNTLAQENGKIGEVNLPNAHLALVEREKITDYLLNPAHPDNGGKASFFLSLGFKRHDWQPFSRALCDLARTAQVAKTIDSPHGRKYILDACIESPSGRTATVRSVWIVDRGVEVPRLVTARSNSKL